MKSIRSCAQLVVTIARNAGVVCWELFRIMIPIVIGVKVLQDLGWISYLAAPLAPVMKLVGLPPEMGLVWASALVNNVYSGIIVLASLVQDQPMTAAQATVICTMMLVAHGLPVELKICQRIGARMWFQGLLRVGSAFLLGFILYKTYSHFNLLQEPALMLWKPEDEPTGWWLWTLGQLKNFASIYVVVFFLIAFLKLLDFFKITNLMIRILGPAMRLMGIGPKAANITIIGLTMGVSYGSGLIIHETSQGKINKRDVFHSLSLMNLSHAMFEDTMLMVLVGGHLSGVFWGRLGFSMIAVALLMRFTSGLSDKTFTKLFFDDSAWGKKKNDSTEPAAENG